MELFKFKENYGELFKNRAYLKLLIASNISRLGDAIDMIAFGWMIYQLTGSELLLGSIFFVNGIPGIILSPFSGVFVDYFSKKLICVIGDFARGVIVTTTALLFLTNNLEIWMIFLFTLLTSSIETLVNPSKTGIFSYVVEEEHYLKGSSLSQSFASAVDLIGAGVAGIIIATLGIFGAILIDGLTFFVSSIILLTLNFTEERENQALNIKSYFINLKSGFLFIYKKNVILISILLMMMINLVLAPISVLMPVYVEKVIHSGAIGLSMLSVGLSLGSILGGIIISLLVKIRKSFLIVFGCAFIGLCITGLSLPAFITIPAVNPTLFATFMFFLIGVGIVFITTPLRTYLLNHTPKDMIGRVFALVSMVTLSMIPIGSAISGTLAAFVPLSVLYLCIGLIILAISFLPLFNKTFRKE